MMQKIKNLLFRFSRLSKPALSVILILLVLGGVMLPTYQAKAFDIITGAIIGSATVMIGGWILTALSNLTMLLVGLGSELLNTVLHNLPYTYTKLVDAAGHPTIVGIGWPIVRDLTNMLFVLILVYIGLTTALRLGGYEVKKIIPLLMGVALLINFTPLIIGFIVDASNIVMNFFVADLNPGAFFESHLAIEQSMIPANTWGYVNPFTNADRLISALALILTDLIVFCILLAFFLLFLLRYVAIWILVILSPLAFACYILPATKKYFKQWWDLLFQWCIVGVSGAFFLYLGTQMFGVMSTPKGGAYTNSSGFLSTLIPMITIVAVFVTGLIQSLSTSAMGAKQVTAGFKRGYKAAGKVAGPKALKAGLATTEWAFKAPFRFTRGIGQGVGQYRKDRKDEKAGRLTLGSRRPISPGLILEEGLESEEIREKPTPTTIAERIRTGAKVVGKIISPGLKEAGFGNLGGKAGAATKGGLKALKDIGKAGLWAGLGVKQKKKPKATKKCPECSKYVADDDDVCRYCGYIFEPGSKPPDNKTLKK